MSVIAGNANVKNVTITFSNGYEITVLTAKTNVAEILKDNGIELEENETVIPALENDIENNTIQIFLKGEEPTEASQILEENKDLNTISEDYLNITEKIIKEQEEIPFETITKDVSTGDGTTVNRVIQSGRNGIKEVTYKVTYKNEIEVSREVLEEKVIKEPRNKIVQVQTKTITSRSSGTTTGTSGVYKVTAYCACASCCGKTNGITASGTRATANRTVAAPRTFAFGTQLVINGQTYTVEDRGGAITGNRIDVYMNSHSEALAWGVRYLNVEVLN